LAPTPSALSPAQATVLPSSPIETQDGVAPARHLVPPTVSLPPPVVPSRSGFTLQATVILPSLLSQIPTAAAAAAVAVAAGRADCDVAEPVPPPPASHGEAVAVAAVASADDFGAVEPATVLPRVAAPAGRALGMRDDDADGGDSDKDGMRDGGFGDKDEDTAATATAVPSEALARVAAGAIAADTAAAVAAPPVVSLLLRGGVGVALPARPE